MKPAPGVKGSLYLGVIRRPTTHITGSSQERQAQDSCSLHFIGTTSQAREGSGIFVKSNEHRHDQF